MDAFRRKQRGGPALRSMAGRDVDWVHFDLPDYRADSNVLNFVVGGFGKQLAKYVDEVFSQGLRGHRYDDVLRLLWDDDVVCLAPVREGFLLQRHDGIWG